MKCRVENCSNPRSRIHFAHYCNKHGLRNSRQGHPTQPAIPPAAIKPLIRELNTFTISLEHDPRPALRGFVYALQEEAASVVRAAKQGASVSRFERSAAQEISMVLEDVLGDHERELHCAFTIIAMFLHREREPRKYRSDDAWMCQLARRFRHLSPRTKYYHWQPDLQVNRVSEKIVRKTTLIAIARLISRVFLKAVLAVKEARNRPEVKLTKLSQEILGETTTSSHS